MPARQRDRRHRLCDDLASRTPRFPSYRDYSPLGHCARVARENGKLTVLAVDAGRIASQTDHGVRLLTASGKRLLRPSRGVCGRPTLSGNRLALRVPGAFQVYDTGSGELITTFPAEGSARLDPLQDLERGIPSPPSSGRSPYAA